MRAASPTHVLAGALLRDLVAGREPVAGPRIVRIDDPAETARAMLRDGLTIGRSAGAELRVVLPEVSREHARIVAAADGFAIADLGSKNGLAVNGCPVAGVLVPLRDGDVIALGPARLRVDGLGETLVTPAPAPRPEDDAAAGNRAAAREPRIHLLAAVLLALALVLAAIAV